MDFEDVVPENAKEMGLVGRLQRRLTVREQLVARRIIHEREVAFINEALVKLDQHKDVEDLLEALGKAGVRQ